MSLRSALGVFSSSLPAVLKALPLMALAYLPFGLFDATTASLAEWRGALGWEGVGGIWASSGYALALLGLLAVARGGVARVAARRLGANPPGQLLDVAGGLALAGLLTAALAIAGFFLLVVPGFLVLVAFAFVGPAIALDGLPLDEALGRSWHLARKAPLSVAALVALEWTLILAPALLLRQAGLPQLPATLLEVALDTLFVPLATALVVVYYLRVSPHGGKASQ